MEGESWTLTGNLDIIGSGDSLQVNSGDLTLSGTVSNAAIRWLLKMPLYNWQWQKTASLSGGLTNNGTVIFNQGNNSTFATGMTGSGNVEKVDSNTLTLTGKNSYTGDTVLHGGTTLVASGATLGVKNSNATVTVENGAAFATAGEVNNNIDILTGGTLAAWNAFRVTPR
jgi:autotransporter-associated beta strand protein